MSLIKNAILSTYLALTGASAAFLAYLTCLIFIKQKTVRSSPSLITLYIFLNITMFSAVPMGIYFLIVDDHTSPLYDSTFATRAVFSGINYIAFRLSSYIILLRVQTQIAKLRRYLFSLKLLLYLTWTLLVIDLSEGTIYFVLATLKSYDYILEAMNHIYTFSLLECPGVLLIVTFGLFALIWYKRFEQCMCKSQMILALTFLMLIFQQAAFVFILWFKPSIHYWTDFNKYLIVVLLQVPSEYMIYAIILQAKGGRMTERIVMSEAQFGVFLVQFGV
eukprot:TRINITY_DN2577_c1_g1_i1.p1 TRINITY_DN2577_c1_g1~~TRINITY_DN2577_c1_g1_i1.p1  ORF type:complete len:277 (+),score=3.00 TRINITY_DN2577_c1_g1_i1:733-1563(+)